MKNNKNAFTLIEMLVVIAIIGIVAGLVINMNSAAAAAKRIAAVRAEKEKLTTMIDNYQSKLNFYPPDNGNLATTNLAYYDATAAVNPLIYELTGATNGGLSTSSIQVFNNAPNLNYNDFAGVFNRANVANGDPGNPQDFYQPPPAPQDYTTYSNVVPGTQLVGLLVPVPFSTTNGAPPNFWHYDSSSPNRHNLSSYDLWAEFITGGKNGTIIITTNGNW